MKDELVQLSTYRKAKGKGFNVHICRCGGYPSCICTEKDKRPTQSLLARWLREIHFIEVESKLNSGLYRALYNVGRSRKALNYHYSITTGINDAEFIFETFTGNDTYEFYEGAFEKGLIRALEFL